MKNIFFLTLAFVSLLFSCDKIDERPNILFIMSDDHAYQAVSAYGYNLNNTPNIDRIAKEGAIFKNGFVTNSICAPSRAVMLTGKHSFVNGKVDNIQDFNWDQDSFAKLISLNSKTQVVIIKNQIDVKKYLNKCLVGNEIVIGMGAGSISKWMRDLKGKV